MSYELGLKSDAFEGAEAVVVAARSADKLDDAEKRIQALGTGCRVLKVPTDISDNAQCKRLAERTAAEFGASTSS